MNCPYWDKCEYQIQLRRYAPTLATEYESEFCNADPTGCARYMLAEALGPSAVPPEMPPFDRDRARRLIAEAPAGPTEA